MRLYYNSQLSISYIVAHSSWMTRKVKYLSFSIFLFKFFIQKLCAAFRFSFSFLLEVKLLPLKSVVKFSFGWKVSQKMRKEILMHRGVHSFSCLCLSTCRIKIAVDLKADVLFDITEGKDHTAECICKGMETNNFLLLFLLQTLFSRFCPCRAWWKRNRHYHHVSTSTH